MVNAKHAKVSALLWAAFIACAITIPVAFAGTPEFPDYYYPNPAIYTNGIVRAVLFYNGILYVGGNFTKVSDKNGTYNRTDLAAYDTATGLVTDFTANTNTGTVRAIAACKGKVYVGGSFTQVNRVSRSKVAALDPTSGAVITEFRNDGGTIDSAVWAVAASDSAVYIGGSFTSVDGTPRHYMAALNATSGTLDQRFDPNPSDPFYDTGKTPGGVFALAMHPNNPKIVFMGGNFQTVAGLTGRKYLCALNSDGTPGPVFQGMDQLHSPVMNMDVYGSYCFAALGGFSNRVICFRIDGTSYTRLWRSVWVNGDVQAVAYTPQGYVYFGCHDGVLDSMDDNRLAVLNATTGKIYDIYPQMNSFFGVRALDMAGSWLAVGGEFTQMNGLSQQYLAIFNKFPFSSGQIQPPAIPALFDPPDSAVGVTLSPYLQWRFAGHAETYEVQVATDPQFANRIYGKTGITEYRQRCTGLKNATEYFWRVRATNSVGTSDWSETWVFGTIPSSKDIPLLAFPADSALNQPLTVPLGWHPTSSARSYRLQFSEVPDLTTQVFDTMGIADTSFTVSGLANDRMYYWRVNAMTVGGESGWSIPWAFITMPGVIEIPVLSQPPDGALAQPVTVTIRWHHVNTAQSYGMQFSNTSDFDPLTLILDLKGIPDTCFTIAGLANAATYYWHVNAATLKSESEWSTPWRFSTISSRIVKAPLCIAPVDNASQCLLQLLLQWENVEDAVSYRVQVATDSAFTALICDTAGFIDTSVIITGLMEDTRYFWRVNCSNDAGALWSVPMRFRTVYPLPYAPLLIAPASGRLATADSLRLVWKKSVPYVTKYRIEIASDSTMLAPLIDTITADTEYVQYHLDDKSVYWWRVQAYNESGGSSYSETRYFKTDFTPQRPQFFLEKVFLAQGRVSIAYSISQPSDIRLELFDLRGKTAGKIIRKNMTAGLHKDRFPARKATAGTYLLSCKIGSSVSIAYVNLVK
jgi:hypothetical protein